MIPLLAALFVGLGLAVVVYGIWASGRAKRESLQRLLEAELAEPNTSPEVLAHLMHRAGGVAGSMLQGTRMLGGLAGMLTRAGWRVKPAEFAGGVAAGTIVLSMLAALAVSRGLGLIVAVASPLAAISVTRVTGRRRTQRIDDGLPNLLQLWASSLESGASMLQAMEQAVESENGPMAAELARVVSETRVGRAFEEALAAMAARVGSRDLEWTVEAIEIQHRTGGRLADTLRVLADFMRARAEVRGEVRALSAEARLSAKVLTALPLLLGGYFLAFRRGYLEPLYTTSMGRMMLVLAVLGLIGATFWMRRIVAVEV